MKFRIYPEQETTYRVVSNLGPKATDKIPVLPDELGTITKAWLIRWAEWVAAGKPEIDRQAENSTLYRLTSSIRNNWKPELHPRDPRTGKFVERSFNVPDGAPDFGDMGTRDILEYLDNEGEDIDAILDPESGVTIDGVPNDATSLDDIETDSGLADSVESLIEDADSVSEAISATESEIEANTNISAVTYKPLRNETEEETRERLRNLASGVELVQDAGWDPELDNLSTTTDVLDDQDQGVVTHGMYEESTNSVYITPSDLERDSDLYTTPDAEKRHTVAFETPEGLVAHEMGHARDYASRDQWDPDNFFGSEVTSQVDKYSEAISEYALTNENEFIAEIQAMVAEGQDVPEFALESYRDINGPEL